MSRNTHPHRSRVFPTLVEGSASTCVPLRHHGLRAATTVRGCPDPLHAIPVRAGLRAIRARARGGARAGLRLSCVHLPWSRAAPAPAFHYATMACHLHHGAWPDATRPLRAIPMCRALSITAGGARARPPASHQSTSQRGCPSVTYGTLVHTTTRRPAIVVCAFACA